MLPHETRPPSSVRSTNSHMQMCFASLAYLRKTSLRWLRVRHPARASRWLTFAPSFAIHARASLWLTSSLTGCGHSPSLCHTLKRRFPATRPATASGEIGHSQLAVYSRRPWLLPLQGAFRFHRVATPLRVSESGSHFGRCPQAHLKHHLIPPEHHQSLTLPSLNLFHISFLYTSDTK